MSVEPRGALCVIPARGGSKRIPRKNVRDFCGKPIIAYSVEAALGSGLFDEVMVSTDDGEVAEVARRFGASVPFMRSAKASDDFATTADVLVEVLAEYEARGRSFDVLCCLYATAPFATAGELEAAFSMLGEGSPSIVAVTDFDFPPQRAFLLGEDGGLSWERPEYALARSQDLPPAAHDAGRFYFACVPEWRAARGFVMPGCRGFRIDPARVQDIDTFDDWAMAEMKYRIWQEGKESE
ncbi:pseudaminic acid cytidylyltransferase [Gordonibacter sp. An230]|uniref:pseudaminic acid cytidylyltransferase n=1 Tax=Gordonibacter sp. An230 TaxID=1965592 RepID=UPI000B3AEE9C|nr:pseudaminic acid cytidylyltransferase [Gordonibacter sp. An230]OUO86399.1 pseudaminic acid cytidylyltransferase [Gordonibacter sp. An230]